MIDFYDTLGVSRDANASEIKKAYRKLAMEHHPDRNPGDKAAEDKFKEAANAYDVLANEEKRARYDRYGHDGLSGAAGGAQGFRGVDDIFSAFGDMFGDFFGGGGRQRATRGADLRLDLTVSFPEAVWGATKEVTVHRKEKCDTCEGKGAKPGSKVERCSTCDGKGQVLHSQGFFMIQATCPECAGEGIKIADPCVDCRGQGIQEKTGTLQVTLPPGIDNGQTLRLAGKGQPAPHGGTAGHLYVVLSVEPDDRFYREDADVLTEVPISYLKATLGGEVEVPSLDEKCEATAWLTVDPGTQPGDTQTRRGKGIPLVGRRGRGDHVVQFSVQIPKKLSKREDELLRELAQEGGEDVAEAKRGLFGRRRGRA